MAGHLDHTTLASFTHLHMTKDVHGVRSAVNGSGLAAVAPIHNLSVGLQYPCFFVENVPLDKYCSLGVLGSKFEFLSLTFFLAHSQISLRRINDWSALHP
jgi:hypothetical protein